MRDDPDRAGDGYPPESPEHSESSSPEGRERRDWKQDLLPVLGWALAWGVFVFSLIVYPGWRAYRELLEFILGWASNAP
jgi:hypothetical protein